MIRLALLFAMLGSPAFAVPAQFTHQGRLMDADGAPMEDSVALTFRVLTDEVDGDVVWEETLTVDLTNGFYAVVLGADVDENPLDTTVFDLSPLWLEVQISGAEAMTPRQPINSVPYATIAGLAEEVQGGPVDATQIAISGEVVIDEDGQWVGESPTVSWTDLTDVPDDFADGVDDDTDTDTDTLVTLGVSCIDGDIARWDATLGAWFCDADQDTWLSAEEVRSYVADSSIDLASGSTVAGSAIVTAADTTVPDWSDLTGMPDDFADGQDADTLADTSCGDAQILVYSISAGTWACGEDTDATLTSAEVQAMVEAMTGLALAADTTIGGQAPRLAGGTVPWADLSDVPAEATTDNDSLADLGCESGQIVFQTDDGWECADLASRFDADLDGVMVWADCDDTDPTLFAIEGDHDCDGHLSADDCNDEDASSTIVADDGDCDGVLSADDCDDDDPASTALADDADCDGHFTGDDCDDADPDIHPDATETCDGLDNNCDGAIDEGTLGLLEACAAESCAAIIADDPASPDGDYYVVFSGTARLAACDMDTDGGGWTQVYANDFEDGDASGWTFPTTSDCGDWSRVLGGYELTSTTEFQNEISAGGIAHSQVVLEMHYLAIDTWDHESGYVYINGTGVWSTSYHYLSGGWTDKCGRTDSIDQRTYIIETRSDSSDTIEIKAGSSLDQSPDDESFAVDNVKVWIR